jgi:membrane protease YdiL (CAAX protease family)
MFNDVPSVTSNVGPSAPEPPSVPWTFLDTWIGFGLFILFLVGLGLLPLLLKDIGWLLSVWVLTYQPLQALPVFAVVFLRGGTLADLGFRRAQPNVLHIGCGLVVFAFLVNILNNLIMVSLRVEVQAQQFSAVFDQLDQPAFLLFTGVVLAPIFEETVLRGFLFGGLRQRLGWVNAALLSSAIFGALHFSIAAFIPTFTLGFIFCYLYQRSNSLWAGIILHTLVNAFGLTAVYLLSQNTDLSTFFGAFLWI